MNYYGYVYKITDLRNGKCYVGQHKYSDYPNMDPNYHGSGMIITELYKKYGPAKFKEEILEWCETKEIANQRELELTEEHNALVDQGGYVLRAGHEGIAEVSQATRAKMSKAQLGRKHPEEVKEKIRIGNLGINRSEETNRRHREAVLGEKNPMYGKEGYWKTHPLPEHVRQNLIKHKGWAGYHHTEESKKKIGLANKGNKSNTGKHWYNNGTKQLMAESCPDGYKEGRLK